MKANEIKKSVVLPFIGYAITGTVTVTSWDNAQGTIPMAKTFIPANKLKKTSFLRCINDGGFGGQSIDKAEIDICLVYGKDHEYEQYHKTIIIDNQRHLLHGKRGISELVV